MDSWNGNPAQYADSYGAPQSPGSFFDQGGAGWIDDFHSAWLFGDKSASSNVIDELLGVNSQKREFAQQEYLQDKQNAYNAPAAQMARMRAAGINPNTAASGIAGGGNESAQAPAVPSNTSGAAQGLAAAAGMLGSFGSAAQGFASANETNTLLELRGEQIRAATIKDLEAAGLNHWNAVSVATLLPTMEANQVADFYLKVAQIDNTRAEYKVILDEHNLKLEQIRHEGNLADEAEENARFAKAQTDFFVSHGYRDDAPLDVSLRNSIVSGNTAEATQIGDAIETASYRHSFGQFSAQVDTAYDIAYNSAVGAAEGNAENEKFVKQLEANVEQVKAFYQAYYALPDDLKSFLAQFLGKGEIGIMEEVNDFFNDRKAPKLKKLNPILSKFKDKTSVTKTGHGIDARW